jgi:hypothetical protein
MLKLLKFIEGRRRHLVANRVQLTLGPDQRSTAKTLLVAENAKNLSIDGTLVKIERSVKLDRLRLVEKVKSSLEAKRRVSCD